MPFFDGANHQDVLDSDPTKRIGENRSTYGGHAGQRDWQGNMQVPSSADAFAQGYQNRGADSNNRAPVQLQYGQANQTLGQATSAINQANADRAAANEARNYQSHALDLQRQAAQGQQPSRAEILGRNMIDQGLKTQVAGAASARGGPLAQMAAQRQVGQGAAAFQQQGANNIAALRAGEMADARNAYMAGASGIRGQDYQGAQGAAQQGLAYGQIGGQQAQMAQAQGGMDLSQRQLNQQRELGYEGLAHDVRNRQADRNLEHDRLLAQNWQFQTDVNRRATDRKTGVISSIIGGLGAVAGGIVSDDTAKIPMSFGEGLQYGAKQGTPLGRGLAGAMGSPRSGPSTGGAMPRVAGASPNTYSDIRSKSTITAPDSKSEPGWLDKFMASQNVQTHDKDPSTHEAMPVDGSALIRDDPYADDDPGYSGGIVRRDPYAADDAFDTDGQVYKAYEDPNGAFHTDDGRRWSEFKGGGRGEVFFSDPAAKRKAFGEGLTYGQGELYWASKGQPNQEALPSYMENKTRSPAPSGQDKMLTVEGPATATSIDPKARGTRPDPSPNRGDRATEQGTPKPQMQGIPPSRDVTGQKPGPLASIQQDANRRGAGFPYAYKDAYRPQEQAPGELNYGFSAQELEKNPLTATAVKRDPDGMRYIDANKLLKTNTAGIASLQQQLDELRYGGRRG